MTADNLAVAERIVAHLANGGFFCTAEERQLLDDVNDAMAAQPDPDIERMMALADAERDVIDAAVTLILPGPGSWFDLADVVHHLLTLRAADRAASFGGEAGTAVPTIPTANQTTNQ